MDTIKRKEIIKNYKDTPIPMGVYQLKNLKNGKILVGSTKNLHAQWGKYLLGFKLNACPIKELQDAWNELGEQGVSFEVIDTLDPKKDAPPKYNYANDLTILKELWIEKLQPFGDRGYNEDTALL